jgi:hypothetical protein
VPKILEFWFDLNVAMKGIVAEMRATQKAKEKSNGPITTRAQALSLAERAKADVAAMEAAAAAKQHTMH